jgi:hypothetical protein
MDCPDSKTMAYPLSRRGGLLKTLQIGFRVTRMT